MMEVTQFWNLVEEVKQEAGIDPDERAACLKDKLLSLTPEQVAAFQFWFDKAFNRADHWDLWGAAYVIGGGCSDDGFMDFRAWLISEGREHFEQALEDADSMADWELPEYCEAESYAYAAQEAFEELGGEDIEEAVAELDIHEEDQDEEEDYQGTRGEPWEEEDLEERFPRLSERFAYTEEHGASEDD
ncbi:DUF4240 domain-containing protein [Massilia sp. W12]|uniref:DUF4240 domain-containing protein n=1 Tax=Massilia sp. W12 TaxID=3126507 RepID=UPI0030CBE856